MKTKPKPVRTTVIFGLICGLILGYLNTVSNYDIYWLESTKLLIWLSLAGYGILLTRWSGTKIHSILFPLLILFIFTFWGVSVKFFLVFALGILSWIRSSICFQKSIFRALAAEFLICFGGIALVAFFDSHSAISWGLGIWMFFLVQALYFLFFSDQSVFEESTIPLDQFKEAKMNAERILSGRHM